MTSLHPIHIWPKYTIISNSQYVTKTLLNVLNYVLLTILDIRKSNEPSTSFTKLEFEVLFIALNEQTSIIQSERQSRHGTDIQSTQMLPFLQMRYNAQSV